MPRGAGGHGTDPGRGWVLGRVWLISYGAGCWVGGCSVWVLCPPASLDLGLDFGLDLGLHFGLGAQRRAQTGLLALLALQGVEASVDQATGPGQSPSHPRSWRGASSSTRTGDIHPPGRASRTHRIRPGWLQPPSPSLLAPKAAEAGAALAAGSASLSHPLQPAKLPGPGSITHQDPAQHGGDAGGLGPRQHEEWL